MVVDQSSLASNTRPFIHTSSQKIFTDFFMHVLDHDRAKGSTFHSNMSRYFVAFATTARQQHEGNCRIIPECLDHAQSVPDASANYLCLLPALQVVVGMVFAAQVRPPVGVGIFSDR